MHPINKFLYYFGFLLVRDRHKIGIPKKFLKEYRKNFRALKKNQDGIPIFSEMRYDVGDTLGAHPIFYINQECLFAASQLSRLKPERILDIGSYRWFILGLLAHYKVVTLDVRKRPPLMENESVVTSDAKNINLPDNSFDTVVSLSSLEHFGLGRYGDEFDTQADKKAFKEMIRVLKPGGHIVFTTHLTRATPSIVYNVHRNYDIQAIRNFCAQLECVDEKFYSHAIGNFCLFEQITTKPGKWDIYCGCWRKP